MSAQAKNSQKVYSNNSISASLTQITEAACPFPVGRQSARVIDMRSLFPVIEVLAQERMVALGLQWDQETQFILQKIHVHLVTY